MPGPSRSVPVLVLDMAAAYPPILDWSMPGRRALLAAHSTTIRLLLDESFSAFLDQTSLAAFGFTDSDPVAQAVAWSMQRFVEAELDPNRLLPASRSFRLFTEIGFWLSQRVGAPRYRSIMRSLSLQSTCSSSPSQVDVAPDFSAGQREQVILDAFAEQLGLTLHMLRVRTCSDMVGFWLEATERERAHWFGWHKQGSISDASRERSKKDRSLYRCSALFRFQCLLHEITARTRDDLAETVAELTLLQPCDNCPPYRRKDDLVKNDLPVLDGQGVRALRQLLREGSSSFLRRLLAILEQPLLSEARRLEWALLRRALSPSTLHAIDLESDHELVQRIRQLPDPLTHLEPGQ